MSNAIRFLVRCSVRRGRSWPQTMAAVQREFGHSLARCVVARREYVAAGGV